MTRPTALSLFFGVVVFLPACASHPPTNGTVNSIADARPLTMHLNGLSCPLCASNADKSLIRISGVFDAQTDLQTGEVSLWVDPAAPPSAEALDNAVLDAGFTIARSASPAADDTGHGPVIKGYAARVAVTASDTPEDAAVIDKLHGLSGVASVSTDHAASFIELTFEPDACLTEGQVRKAVERTGYAAGALTVSGNGGDR